MNLCISLVKIQIATSIETSADLAQIQYIKERIEAQVLRSVPKIYTALEQFAHPAKL